MIAILTLLFVLALSILITKTATLALVHTGMARERARFQARSAFSGAGFTTSESEVVVKHPVRRRIITGLILLGNAGVVTAVSSLILSFVSTGEQEVSHMRNIYLLLTGIALLYLSTRSKRLDQMLERIINRLLENYTDIRPKSFSKIITVMEDYEVTELNVKENEWVTGQTLAELKLPDEGILILGIIRDDSSYIGVPRGRYKVEESDRLVVYGKADQIAKLSKRSDKLGGKQEHNESVAENEKTLKQQDEEVDDSN